MPQDKLWVCKEVPDEAALELSRESGISILTARVFISRGIEDSDYIKSFLNPSLEGLHDPFLMKDMDKAADRIAEAILKKEKIIIYGDYDVDGITSTSILMNFLSELGANTVFFIPDRINEGYGLSIDAIDKLLVKEPSLIITVDCGITSLKEVEYIKKNNIDIIITDHHECREELPDAYAVINPLRHDCSYPFKELAGVGIAYKLVNALCIKMQLGDMHLAYLDLTAIGTVADVVPLTGENRIIVKYGLKGIENSRNLGIQTMINNCALKDKIINSWTISFVLAPRINAAGRIGDAGRAVRLFTTCDPKEAQDIVSELNDENRFRQETEQEILNEVLEKIEAQVDFQKDRVIVISGEGWHHGVIGIVSSRITERFYRPCILFSHENGICKGSGRSIEGFNLFKAICSCEDLLENFGGHELAAGMSIKYENLEKFKEKINQYALAVLNEEDMVPRIKIDTKVVKDDITLFGIRELERLAPFGAGNPCPVFLYDKLKVSDIRTVGENRHLRIRLEDNNFFTDAIGFNMGGLINYYNNMDILDAVFSLEINKWNSSEKVQLNLKDLRYNEEMIMEKQYYYSLDKCSAFFNNEFVMNFKESKRNICSSQKNSGKNEEISDIIKECNKVVIIVNALESAKKIVSILKKCMAGIKKQYVICYTCFNKIKNDSVYIVINPGIEEIDFEGIDHIIFYGTWIDNAYLNMLMDKTKDKNVSMLLDNSGFDIDDIIPERRDLVAVYQYLKANVKEELIIDDIFLLAREIALSYRMNMNYFKLKKCIEILEELKLLAKEINGQYGMIIRFSNSIKEKTKLENSSLYRMLQFLKSQLNTLILKEGG